MAKLKQQTTAELACRYYDVFGYTAETDNKYKLIASLYYNKRISSLTAEEIDSVEEEL